MNGIYAAYKNSTEQVSEKKSAPEQTYQKGQVIEGIISKVSDKISIDFSGKEITFPKDTIENPKKGEVRKFEVIESSKNRLVLKEIKNAAEQNTVSQPITCTIVETDKQAVSERLKSQKESESETVQEDENIKQITEEDYKELSKEGFALEEYDLERLDRAVARIKEQRTEKEESVEIKKEELKAKVENAKQTAKTIIADSGLAERIAERLIKANLPVTEENITRIAAAMKQAEEINYISDNSAAYLIKNELEPSIQNIYKALHSGQTKEAEISNQVWNDIEPSVYQTLKASLPEVGQEEMKISKWLLSKELPITVKNVSYYKELMQIKGIAKDEILEQAVNAVKEKKEPEEAVLGNSSVKKIEDIIQSFAQVTDKELELAVRKAFKSIGSSKETINSQRTVKAEEAGKAGEAEKSRETVKSQEIIERNNTIESKESTVSNANILQERTSNGTDSIQSFLIQTKIRRNSGENFTNQQAKEQNHSNQQPDISLSDLQKIKLELAENQLAAEQPEVLANAQNNEFNIIQTKRQLEEIRLKLTTEAGQRLIRKGIHLETDGLTRIVEGLRELEQEYYKNLMKEAGGTESPNDISLLEETVKSLENLKTAPAYLLSDTFSKRTEITVGDLSKEGTACRKRAELAEQNYESLMTSPRSDMGDSIQKAFRNVDQLLEGMNLETTEANRRAVRILGYNEIEVTQENIEEMKLYDAKVNEMLRNMQPPVTVEMIRRGENPLAMTVDEVREEASAIKQELGVTQEERFSHYLARIEKKEGITEQERNSYIGIYRLLNQITKTDGAAIGAVVKAGQDLTLSNLLTAVRTMKGQGIDADINDTFGLPEVDLSKRNAIDKQIASGITQKQEAGITKDLETKTEYGQYLTEQIRESITPDKLDKIQSEGKEKIGSMSLERLKETLEKTKEDTNTEDAYLKEQTQEIRTVLNDSEETLRFLKENKISRSISMISAAKQLSMQGGLADTIQTLAQTTAFNEAMQSVLKNERSSSEISQSVLEINQTVSEINHSDSNISKVYSRLDEMNSATNESTLDSEVQKTQENAVIDSLDSIFAKLNDKDVLQKEYQDFIEHMDQAFSEILNSSDHAGEIKTLSGLRNQIRLAGNLAKQEYYEIPLQTKQGITNMNLRVIHGSETGQVSVQIQGSHGKVRAEAAFKEQGLHILVTAETKAGLEQVQAEENTLKQNLESLGLEVKQINYGVDKSNINQYYKRASLTGLDSKETSQEHVDTAILYQAAKEIVKTLSTEN